LLEGAALFILQSWAPTCGHRSVTWFWFGSWSLTLVFTVCRFWAGKLLLWSAVRLVLLFLPSLRRDWWHIKCVCFI